MKKYIFILLTVTMIMSCSNQKSSEMEITEIKMENTIFPKGQPAEAAYFKGKAWVNPLVQKESYTIGDVIFEPGCRNNWHYHPVGQVLLVTDGEGWYQEKGKPAQRIKRGDVVNIPKDVIHWHGATHDSHLVHLAITDNSPEGAAVWLEPVADEEYDNLH